MRWTLRKPNTRRALWWSLGGLFLVVGVYHVFGDNGLMSLRRKLREEREWQQRNEATRRQNEALEKSIHDLKTDPKVIEKIAREELMLAHPDDRVILTPQKK